MSMSEVVAVDQPAAASSADRDGSTAAKRLPSSGPNATPSVEAAVTIAIARGTSVGGTRIAIQVLATTVVPSDIPCRNRRPKSKGIWNGKLATLMAIT